MTSPFSTLALSLLLLIATSNTLTSASPVSDAVGICELCVATQDPLFCGRCEGVLALVDYNNHHQPASEEEDNMDLEPADTDTDTEFVLEPANTNAESEGEGEKRSGNGSGSRSRGGGDFLLEEPVAKRGYYYSSSNMRMLHRSSGCSCCLHSRMTNSVCCEACRMSTTKRAQARSWNW